MIWHSYDPHIVDPVDYIEDNESSRKSGPGSNIHKQSLITLPLLDVEAKSGIYVNNEVILGSIFPTIFRTQPIINYRQFYLTIMRAKN